MLVTEQTGARHVKGASDQDCWHCAKKMVAGTDSATRSLRLGLHVVHINALKEVMEAYDKSAHGMNQNDASRSGYEAMDVPSVIRASNPQAVACLRALQGNDGIVAYQGLIHRYVSIPLSKKQTISARIKSAAFVVTFLRLWRQWVKRTPGLTLANNFITREAFQDTLISCHFFVTMIMLHRDFTPDIALDLSRVGTDCVEDLWSAIGGMVLNKRT